MSLDESFLTSGINGVAGSTPVLASTSTTGDYSGAFTTTPGADGATTTYGLSLNTTVSGLVDAQTGQAVVLVLNGNTVEAGLACSHRARICSTSA